MRLKGCCLRWPSLSLIFQEEGCETASVSSQPDRSAFKKIEKKLKKIEKKNWKKMKNVLNTRTSISLWLSRLNSLERVWAINGFVEKRKPVATNGGRCGRRARTDSISWWRRFIFLFFPTIFHIFKKMLWIFLKFNLTFFERKVNSDYNLIDS